MLLKAVEYSYTVYTHTSYTLVWPVKLWMICSLNQILLGFLSFQKGDVEEKKRSLETSGAIHHNKPLVCVHFRQRCSANSEFPRSSTAVTPMNTDVHNTELQDVLSERRRSIQ